VREPTEALDVEGLNIIIWKDYTMRAKTFWAVLIAVALVLIAAWAIDVDTSGKFKAPEIVADVKPGELPDVDVDTADIDIREKKAEVNIPDVDVNMKKTEVPYPSVDVQSPEENDRDRLDE
jgi:hypothetical protein